MPDVSKLKKKAADLELKKQFDKALEVYVEILASFDSADEEIDVSLFNRVGDMYLKQGNVAEAVDYYEQAVDRYADGGFHNNAIALCNKILRNSPGRASVYYKLGKISAQKGFKGDAKKNFLEYADRMQSAGKTDEAFRALKEFADLCPDQDDIRLMLADQLSKKGRSQEAIEQLQLLYERYTQEGRTGEARAATDRMKAIDPTYVPRDAENAPRRNVDDLVFLDLGDSGPPKRSSLQAKQAMIGLDLLAVAPVAPVVAPGPPPRPTPAHTAASTAATPIIPIEVINTPIVNTPMIEPAVLDGMTRISEFETNEVASGSLLEGLEPTSFSAPAASAPPMLDFETTSLADDEPPAADLLEFDIGIPEVDVAPEMEAAPAPDLLDFDLPGEEEERRPRTARQSIMGLPMLIDEEGHEPDVEEDDSSIGGDLELIMPEGTPARGVATTPVDDLPLMDLDLPHPGESTAAITGALGRNSLEIAVTPSEPADGFVDLTLEDGDVSHSPRQSMAKATRSVEMLEAACGAAPDDHGLRRQFAEALLEKGDREAGLNELENAMVGYERADDLTSAAMLADEIVLLNPASVRHHQKRVEYAFRTNERPRLIEAYLQLADALFRAGQIDKSRAIYQRVIDLSPDDIRAQAALDSFPPPEASPDAPAPKTRSTVPQKRVSVPTPAKAIPAVPSPVPDDEFVDLGSWLRDDEVAKDTRMVVDEREPTGDEAADFQDMLRKFKQGISENVEEEDHQSHYDLGVAYKEMGLLDEAIAEFQKALRAPSNRVPTYEALGLCFIEKAQYPMAATILSRGLNEPGMQDDQLVGVLYLLGRCAEERGQREAAIEFYQRVFVQDIQFRDVGERLAAVEGAAR